MKLKKNVWILNLQKNKFIKVKKGYLFMPYVHIIYKISSREMRFISILYRYFFITLLKFYIPLGT